MESQNLMKSNFVLIQCKVVSILILFLNFRLQTRQWSEKIIRKETREWLVKGGLVQVDKKH